ncbi:MAG: FG-GAP repeat domain-containing protein [Candidatus Hydrogenedentota bacterium]
MTYCLFAALLVTMGAGAQPQVLTLTTQYDIWNIATEDLTGNGREDILAVMSDEESDPLIKQVAVFLAMDEGGYPGEPSFVLDLDPRIGNLFLADVDGEAPRELVVTHSQGATVHQWADGGFEVLAEPEFMSILPQGSKRPRFLEDVAVDLMGDGRDEWLIPMPTGFAVRNVDGHIADIRAEVQTVARGSGDRGVTIRYDFPAFQPFDIREHEHKGMAFLTDEHAEFAYGPNWRQHHRFRLPRKLDDRWQSDAQLMDINDNGLPDLVVTQTQGTVNMTAQTQIYFAEDQLRYPREPSALFESEGAFATPVLVDVNGDGRKDVVHLKVPYSIGSFVSYFLRGRLTVNAEVYLCEEDGFDTSPAYTGSFPVQAPEDRRNLVYSLGDFNGNGRKDVAYGVGENELAVYTGGEDEFLSSQPWVSVEVSPYGEAVSEDLTGNGHDDIMIHDPDSEQSKQIRVVLFE